MTPNAQRVAIAEACGWTEIDADPRSESYRSAVHPVGKGRPGYGRTAIPDYLNSLDAMHEAEKVLTKEQQRTYFEHLVEVARSGSVFATLHATAAQRAEAFLRTLNLWDVSK